MEMWPATINGYLAHARLAQAARYVDSFVYRCLRISGRLVLLTGRAHVCIHPLKHLFIGNV